MGSRMADGFLRASLIVSVFPLYQLQFFNFTRSSTMGVQREGLPMSRRLIERFRQYFFSMPLDTACKLFTILGSKDGKGKRSKVELFVPIHVDRTSDVPIFAQIVHQVKYKVAS